MSLIELPLGYSAFGVSITLPFYYQAEEKYGEKIICEVDWNGYEWLDRVMGASGRVIPLSFIKVDAEVIKTSNENRDNPETIINWTAMLDTLVGVALIIGQYAV